MLDIVLAYKTVYHKLFRGCCFRQDLRDYVERLVKQGAVAVAASNPHGIRTAKVVVLKTKIDKHKVTNSLKISSPFVLGCLKFQSLSRYLGEEGGQILSVTLVALVLFCHGLVLLRAARKGFSGRHIEGG